MVEIVAADRSRIGMRIENFKNIFILHFHNILAVTVSGGIQMELCPWRFDVDFSSFVPSTVQEFSDG